MKKCGVGWWEEEIGKWRWGLKKKEMWSGVVGGGNWKVEVGVEKIGT